jgi:hypothetical protein
LRNAGVVGSEVRVGDQWDDALDAEWRGLGAQCAGAPDVVFESNRVAYLRAEFAGGPVVQGDAIVGEFGVERRHHGIGDSAIADADSIRQVGQNRLCTEAERLGGGGHGVAD